MNKDLGLLVLRLAFGLSMAALHGWGKITHPEKWAGMGGVMSKLGISFLPQFWGFMASFSEFGAALLIAAGIYFRTATALLGFTMFMAALMHLTMDPASEHAGWKGAEHALEYMVVCVALFLTGPGKFAIELKRSENA